MLIAVVNSKGGVGKSTIAVHLAAWLHEQGRKVAVVDADVQGSSSQWLAEAVPDIEVVGLHTADDIIKQGTALLERAEVVVADGPAGLADQTRALLLIADLAVVPLSASALDLRAAAQAADVVRQARLVRRGAGPRAVLVLNRVQMHTRLGQEVAEAAVELGLPVAGSRVAMRTALADACGQGSLVWRMGAAAKPAADDIIHLFEELLAHAGAEEVQAA